MVLISKEEKEAIRNRFPSVHIVRTMKQRSGRHRYYMVEAPGAMRMLRQLRNPCGSKQGGGHKCN